MFIWKHIRNILYAMHMHVNFGTTINKLHSVIENEYSLCCNKQIKLTQYY